MSDEITDERLAEIRADIEYNREQAAKGYGVMSIRPHIHQMTELLAEIDRLRVEQEATRAIVRAVAEDNGAIVYYDFGEQDRRMCAFCQRVEQYSYPEPGPFTHDPTCPVMEAQALVAQWDGEDTSQ